MDAGADPGLVHASGGAGAGQGPVAAGGGAEVLLASGHQGAKGPVARDEGVADPVPDQVALGGLVATRPVVPEAPNQTGDKAPGQTEEQQDAEDAEQQEEG